jgi:hypothetical protein
MKAALELGRWVFLAPLGYMNAPRMLGKSLMPDPARAPLVRRAFEEYATGRFTKQQLLQQVTAWGLRNRRGQPLSSQAIGCCATSSTPASQLKEFLRAGRRLTLVAEGDAWRTPDSGSAGTRRRDPTPTSGSARVQWPRARSATRRPRRAARAGSAPCARTRRRCGHAVVRGRPR